jgi:Helix-turn-helix domain
MIFHLRPGEAFNPYRMFTGLFIPEGLARSSSISAGAKIAWGRLARYAGEDGLCFPTVNTLGREIGVGERQAQKYLAELEKACLIRRVERFANRAQTSNGFEFLWHEMFQKGVNDRSGEGVNDDSPGGVNDRSPKESQIEESHLEEKKRLRLSGHESQKTRFATGAFAAACNQYPQLREALADYMQGQGEERVYPRDRHVVDVMDAAEGATEQEVIDCLQYLRQERGLMPGTLSGPRHFSWFPTVVGDYFRRKRERQAVTNPAGSSPPGDDRSRGLSEAVFDSMTETIEIDGLQWRA